MNQFTSVYDLAKALKEDAEIICNMNKKQTRKIKESVFKQSWLQDLLHNLDENVSKNWIHQVSGTPFDKVLVVNDNDDTIVIVPSFCESTSQYIKQDFLIYDAMSAIKSASESKRYDIVNKHYGKLINSLNTNPFPLEDLKRWIHIAEYYNENPAWLSGFKRMVEKNNKVVNPTSNVTTGKKDDDFTVFEPV